MTASYQTVASANLTLGADLSRFAGYGKAVMYVLVERHLHHTPVSPLFLSCLLGLIKFAVLKVSHWSLPQKSWYSWLIVILFFVLFKMLPSYKISWFYSFSPILLVRHTQASSNIVHIKHLLKLNLVTEIVWMWVLLCWLVEVCQTRIWQFEVGVLSVWSHGQFGLAPQWPPPDFGKVCSDGKICSAIQRHLKGRLTEVCSHQ